MESHQPGYLEGPHRPEQGHLNQKTAGFLDRQTFARGMWKVSSTDYPAKIKDALSKRGFVVYLSAPWEDGLNCVQIDAEQLH